MSQAKLTFNSALWNHAGKILEYLLMYVTSIVIARGLGVEENGRFVGLFSLSQLLLALCSFGLETSLNKFIPQLTAGKLDAQAATILRYALMVRIVSVIAGAIFFYLAILWFTIPFFSASGSVLLYVLCFTVVRSIFPLFAIVLTAQLRTALTARINFFVRVVELVAILVLAQISFTVENIFVLFLMTSALHVSAYAVFSRMNILRDHEQISMQPIIAFGGIYWINTIVDFVLGRQGDVLFLTNLLPNSSEGGLYDVAFSIAQLASMAMTIGLTGVTFATFARLAVSDQATMDRFYSFSIRIISLLTIPLYAFLLFNAGDVLKVLYSSQYLAAIVLVQGILSFRMLSRLFGGPENAEYLLSQGRVGTLVAFGVAAAIVNVALNILLIPHYGAFGTVIASGSANLVVNMLAAFAVLRASSNRLQFSFWVKISVVCLVVAFGCSYFLPSGNVFFLALNACIYGVVVGLLFTVVKPLAQVDLEWLTQLDHRVERLLHRFTHGELTTAR